MLGRQCICALGGWENIGECTKAHSLSLVDFHVPAGWYSNGWYSNRGRAGKDEAFVALDGIGIISAITSYCSPADVDVPHVAKGHWDLSNRYGIHNRVLNPTDELDRNETVVAIVLHINVVEGEVESNVLLGVHRRDNVVASRGDTNPKIKKCPPCPEPIRLLGIAPPVAISQ